MSLAHESWHSQSLWVTNIVSEKSVLAVNNILRCESLNSDFNQFCKILGIAEKKLPHTKLYRTDAEVFG